MGDIHSRSTAATDALNLQNLQSLLGSPPLWYRLGWLCAPSLGVAGFLYLGIMAGSTTLPAIFGLIMSWLLEVPADFRLGALYVLALAGAVYLGSFSTQFFELACFKIGARARDAIAILIFDKMLRLRSVDAGTNATPGTIHTLTAVDAIALEGLFAGAISTFLIPLEMIIILGLLWILMKWAMLAGMAALVLCLGASFLASRRMQILAEARGVISEERGGLTYELLASSLAVKLRAWEPFFESRILERRAAESRFTRRMGWMQV